MRRESSCRCEAEGGADEDGGGACDQKLRAGGEEKNEQFRFHKLSILHGLTKKTPGS